MHIVAVEFLISAMLALSISGLHHVYLQGIQTVQQLQQVCSVAGGIQKTVTVSAPLMTTLPQSQLQTAIHFKTVQEMLLETSLWCIRLWL